MNDKDKVISGLEHCSEDGCQGCPYETDCKMADGFSDLAKDALELINYQDQHIEAFLRDQEPRVLTHKEVIELDEGKSVWFEESDGSGNTFIGPMVCHGKGLFGNRYMCVDAKRLYWFGRRFWNAKPTDEQRKAVKWDD